MDYRLALMCGTDIPLPLYQLTIHQPSLKEISYIGEEDFFTGIQCLCINKTMFLNTEDKNLLSNTNNFQIFMMIVQEKEAKDKKDAIIKVLSLIFPNYKVLFTPSSILLNNSDESVIIDINNFEEIQEVFKLIFCTKTGPMDKQTFNPADEKAKEIAQKLMRGRQRIANERAASNTSIFSQYLSTLAIGLHQSIEELQKLTMFQIYDLIERFSLWLNWDLDVRQRLAGGKPSKEAENWMKSLH